MLDAYPDVMTVAQLASALGIGINSAYRLIHTGKIGTCQVGRKILVPKVCILDYLDFARYNSSSKANKLPVPERGDI